MGQYAWRWRRRKAETMRYDFQMWDGNVSVPRRLLLGAEQGIGDQIGKPVWLLAPRARGKIWYWFPGRENNPWYPSMRIFEQRDSGDWRPVLAAVARDLRALVRSGV